MIAPARRAATEAVLAVERRKRDLATALDRARRPLEDPRDRALATEIAHGVFRWRGAIDFLLARQLRTGLESLAPAVLAALRTAAYQLVWLDRLPAHAVVNDAVELARALGQPHATGLVNAVARRLPRSLEAAALPGPGEPGFWTATCSLPGWLASRWRARLGDRRAAAWAEFALRPPRPVLRVNTWRLTRDEAVSALAAEGITARALPSSPTALAIDSGDVGGSRLLVEGLAGVQDEGSQLVAAFAGVGPGERVLDVCAAPGGKTLALWAAAGSDAVMVAADRRPARVALLRATLRHAGADRVGVVEADAAAGVPLLPIFDCVLADVPCSGLGTIRRDPDIKWTRREADLARLAETGRQIADRAADAVRPGGRLVFATCTTEPEENDEVVEAFLASHPDFALERPGQGDLAPFLDGAFLRTAPDVHGLDGFFAAVLRKAGSGPGGSGVRSAIAHSGSGLR